MTSPTPRNDRADRLTTVGLLAGAAVVPAVLLNAPDSVLLVLLVVALILVTVAASSRPRS